MAPTVSLRVQELTKTFGGLTALKEVSFAVEEGSITGLIGPNGSGKTVAFDCITGFYKPDQGRAFFRNQDITGLRPYEIARLGVGRSFQITGIFPKLTVLQNLFVAAQEKALLRNVTRTFRLGRRGADAEETERIRQGLESLGLRDAQGESVANLSYGQQKLLELAGLMLMSPEPSLYLLDEPFAGLTQMEISHYISLMKKMREGGKTFLIVEHNMRAIMDLCDTIVVLDHGEKIAEGPPHVIQRDASVIQAYLGRAAAS